MSYKRKKIPKRLCVWMCMFVEQHLEQQFRIAVYKMLFRIAVYKMRYCIIYDQHSHLKSNENSISPRLFPSSDIYQDNIQYYVFALLGLILPLKSMKFSTSVNIEELSSSESDSDCLDHEFSWLFLSSPLADRLFTMIVGKFRVGIFLLNGITETGMIITGAGSIPYICRFIQILYRLDNFLLKSERLGQVLVSHFTDDKTEAQSVINQYMVTYGKELNTKIFHGLFYY